METYTQKYLKTIKEAIVSYVKHSACMRQMLKVWSSRNRTTPNKWTQAVSAVFENGPQSQYKSWLNNNAILENLRLPKVP